MASLFRKAVREEAKLRMATIGPSGSGKTWTSLELACEIARLIRESGRGPGRVAGIDSEQKSMKLYAKKFDFDVMDLERHSPLDYVAAFEAAEAEGYDVIVCDSLSHAWIGKDGALEQVDKAVERGAGNSFSAWRSITPKHNKLVEKILSVNAHLFVTIRAKTAYVQEKNDKGKTEIKKLGLEAVQRDGLEYEFTLVGDMDLANNFRVSKTRLDGVIAPGEVFERPGVALARKIYGWLMDGAAPAERAPAPVIPIRPEPPPVPREEVAAWAGEVAKSIDASADYGTPEDRETRAAECAAVEHTSAVAAAIDDAFVAYMSAMTKAESLADLDRLAGGPGAPPKGSDQHRLATAQYKSLRAEIKKRAAEAAS